jgi:predicted secreted protein
VLPFGIRSQREAGTVAPGSDPGAPAATRLGRIAFWNSLVAGAAFLLFRYVLWPLL